MSVVKPTPSASRLLKYSMPVRVGRLSGAFSSPIIPISFTARIFSKFSGVNLTVPSVSFVHPMSRELGPSLFAFSTVAIKGRLVMISTATVHSAFFVPSAVVTVTVASPYSLAVRVHVPSLLSCIVTKFSGVTLHVTVYL